MHNLLPEQERSLVARDYAARVITVLFLGMSAVALIAALLLLPAYGYLSARAASVPTEESSAFLKKLQAEQEALAIAAEMISFVPTERSAPDPSVVFERLRAAALKSGGVELLHFGLVMVTGDVTVRGSARTREALIAFSKALREEPLFYEMVVPVELLAKSKNISFELHGKLRAQ